MAKRSFEAGEKEPKGMKESGEKNEPVPGKPCPTCGQMVSKAKGKPAKMNASSAKPAWQGVADKMMGKS